MEHEEKGDYMIKIMNKWQLSWPIRIRFYNVSPNKEKKSKEEKCPLIIML